MDSKKHQFLLGPVTKGQLEETRRVGTQDSREFEEQQKSVIGNLFAKYLYERVIMILYSLRFLCIPYIFKLDVTVQSYILEYNLKVMYQSTWYGF
jgi:hypothetical protein